MNAWSLIPSGFGLWWLASGLAALQLLSVWSWIGLVTGAVVVAASGIGRQSLQMVNRRTFRLSVLAEGAGIAVILLACDVSRRPDLIMPLVGTVVGLHVLPLAKAFGDRRFLLSGSLMIVVCLCSLTWPLPVRTAIAGIGAGGILWAFALWGSSRVFAPVRPACLEEEDSSFSEEKEAKRLLFMKTPLDERTF